MKKSAGILAYRKVENTIELFLVHPGGPFWKNKDIHGWSIPKGEFNDNENPVDAALREFHEETGYRVSGELTALRPVKQPGGKIVHVWAVEADFDADKVTSNTFSLEWPPGSGKLMDFPEIDRAGWFSAETAIQKIHKGQMPFIEQLVEVLKI